MKRKIVGAVAILFALAFALRVQADLFPVTNLSGDPNTFEFDLTAVERDVTIAGTNVHIFTYKDEAGAVPPASGGIPVPVVRVKVGDLIICRFKNQLASEIASIHWHGIELDNDSDGTAVTQDAVLPGQSYTYKFQTFRPGVFWFHSHMLPGNTLFGGLYGVMIIENNAEAGLISSGVLPDDAHTFTLAMSDIEFDATGKIGKQHGGVTKTENELIELCHLWSIGDAGGDNTACSASSRAGATVLVNGRMPDAAAETPKFTVPSGKRIRLRLLNESISRHFRLKLLNSDDNKLYRIGGQGGLLENIVLEGGMKDAWDTKYDLGEIVLGSGVRADVLIYPTGSDGDIIQLVGNPLGAPFNISGNSLGTDYPIAYFQISGTASEDAPSAGDPILEGTTEEIEDIKASTVTALVDPAPDSGSADETIRLTTTTPTGPVTYVDKQPGIDGWAAVLDGNAGNGDWLLVPKPPIARYARIGDVLELTVRNDTDAVHPYHLHGFSMQPVRMIDNATGNILYEFEYEEFLDTIDVYGHQSYVFRTRIDDRAKICDETPDGGPVLAECAANPCGGVVGRWLYHCHIVNHGGLGMIGEITILPGVDSPPEITCPANITTTNDVGNCSAVVNFTVTASDDCGEVTVVCVPPSGSAFPVGTTTVTCTATDSLNQTTQCTFDITVTDVEKPKLTSTLGTTAFWSPSHDLVNVGLSASATDNCPTPVTITVAVYGDEDDELSMGDGRFAPDAKNIAVGTLRLRSERFQKSDGRVYIIILTATDGSGNQTIGAHTVVVPKNQTVQGIASVNSQATAAIDYVIANGTPPPGFVVIGDGPVIGSKQ